MRCVDPKFPGLEKYAAGFDLHEEWYSLKDFSPDLHVLLVQETESMKGIEYQRPAFPAGEGRAVASSEGADATAGQRARGSLTTEDPY